MEEMVAAPAVAVTPRPRPWTVFLSGSFRKLWVATTLSLFGDFFTYVRLARYWSCKRFRGPFSCWWEARLRTASRRVSC